MVAVRSSISRYESNDERKASMSPRNGTGLALGIAAPLLLAFVLAGCGVASSDAKDGVAAEETTGQVTQKLTGTHKICSGYAEANWRDSIEVDDSWGLTTCRGWANSIGAPRWQVGCLTSSRVVWGTTGGGLPAVNCGW